MKRVIVALSLLSSSVAFAGGRPPPAGATVTYEKKTVINFEDDTIQGDLTKPDGEYVESRKKVRHSNLIKIREEFKDKVLQSVGEL
ncbi:MAG: adventurous gliding motility protein CglF [Deltaproteobacteria bacterium]|nr:adventurous gliding motility protein CglF [Deltaproteobacteria bacterium]